MIRQRFRPLLVYAQEAAEQQGVSHRNIGRAEAIAVQIGAGTKLSRRAADALENEALLIGDHGGLALFLGAGSCRSAAW